MRKLLELEIDELLQVRRDELIYDEDSDQHVESHQRQRSGGEPNPIPPFEMLRQPVDDHTQNDEREDIAILPNHIRNHSRIPLRTNLIDHILGGHPSLFIRLCGVQIGAGTEEETRPRDEDEGLYNRPSSRQRFQFGRTLEEMVEHTEE